LSFFFFLFSQIDQLSKESADERNARLAADARVKELSDALAARAAVGTVPVSVSLSVWSVLFVSSSASLFLTGSVLCVRRC
jgi:hypothetical protein